MDGHENKTIMDVTTKFSHKNSPE